MPPAQRHPHAQRALQGPAGYDRLDADMRRDFGEVGWWFNASALTQEETAERIVREAARYPLLSPGGESRP